MDWLFLKMEFQQTEDWYNIKAKHIQSYGGDGLLTKMSGHSPPKLVMSVYPEHNWLPWKFGKVPVGYWNTKDNQRKFMDWFATQSGIYCMEHWQSITKKQIVKKGGEGLLAKHKNSISRLLMYVYPEYLWTGSKFGRKIKFLSDLCSD